MTRKQLKAISTIQTLIGRAESFHGNDRDRDGFEKGQNALREAFRLCLDVLSPYPPQVPDEPKEPTPEPEGRKPVK